ncbi:MAG TPA: wax ester/triacylglycerol synthase family O-acyltransferase [Candidatus Elarobacter sp.]|nr:wax ester/triacylglycerol synthase family O-acyltransferase [Candidatus Elarobacter sp.]
MSEPTNGSSRMTSLDAAFYYLERTGQLLHVGGVYTVEGAIDFERLLTDLAARMHLIPRYTERVVSVPLNLAHPTWEPDPQFDIRHHVLHHKLRPPGGDEQLVTLVSRLFAQPLKRSRPLWELHQIDGYRGDRSVIFAKVHHCMVDGVSGVQLLGVMFDPSPNPAPVPPPEGVREAPPLPTPTAQLVRAVREGVQDGLARVQAVADLVRNPRRALAELGHAADAVAELGRMVLSDVPSTPFNGHVSILRRIVWTTFSLNEVKAVKDRLGGTVNDVVLSTISAALRTYLERAGLNPDRIELRAMLPVNVRRSDEHLKLGNRVSMLVAPLPVRIFDPLERLRQVRAATAHLKERGQAARFTRALDLMDLLPAAVQKPLGWLQVQASPINTVCTNVPGPLVSLYVQGKRLEKLVPVVPLTQGVGLAFAILSYADTLTIGITADPALVPNGESLCDLLQAGFDELRVLAGVERAERRGAVRPERQRRPPAAPSQVA